MVRQRMICGRSMSSRPGYSLGTISMNPFEMITRTTTTVTFSLPISAFNTICLGVDRRSSDEGFKQHGFFLAVLSEEPQRSGEDLKVFTLGILILRAGNKVRAGLIKRHQLLVKV